MNDGGGQKKRLGDRVAQKGWDRRGMIKVSVCDQNRGTPKG